MYQETNEAIDDCSQSEAEIFYSISEETKPLLPISTGSQDIDSISEGNKPLLPLGTGSQNIDSISEGNKPLLPMGAGNQDKTQFKDNLNECSNKNWPLQERDSNTRVSDFDDNSFGEVVTEVNDLGKPDLLKGEMFPKFSNVKKIKTRYGKVKIHYTDSLDADKEERIVEESVKLLKRFKDEDIEVKKMQKEDKLQRQNNGSSIGNCFRCISCDDRADE
jgi:hypothetical protein